MQGAVAVEGEMHIWRPGRRGSSNPTVKNKAGESPAEPNTSFTTNGILGSIAEVSQAVEKEIAVQKDMSAGGTMCSVLLYEDTNVPATHTSELRIDISRTQRKVGVCIQKSSVA